MSKRNLRGFGFERLEDRRLLAADCCAEVFQCCDVLPAETCQVSTMEVEDGVVESEFEELTVAEPETAIEGEIEGAELVDESANDPECEKEAEADVDVVESVELPTELDNADVVETVESETDVLPTEPEILMAETDSQDSEPETEGDAILDEMNAEVNCETVEDSEVADVTEEVTEGVPVSVEVIEAIDQELEMVECEAEAEVDVTAETEVGTEVDTEVGAEVIAEVEVEAIADVEGDVVAEAEVEVEAQLLGDSELRDPVTGTSGYFGEIDEVTPTKSMTFTPSETGVVDVVVASSFGDSETRLEITDADGDLVAATMTEDLSGFQKLTFDVVEKETYEISVASDEFGKGYFMVTVEFEAASEPVSVDLHANVVGETATLLEGQDGTIAVESALETAEDCDAFRFVASDNGEMLLGMTAASEDHQSNAIVSVFNPAGDLVVSGTTNEEVAIRFDANSGVEYQVLVDSLNDVPTQFSLNGTLFADPVDEADPIDELANVADTILVDEVNVDIEDEMDFCGVDLETDEAALVDEVFEELGNDMMSENDSMRDRFSGRSRGPWFRRI